MPGHGYAVSNLVHIGAVQVHYGVKGGNLTQSAEATSDTYTAADLCGGIANASGYIYPGALYLPGVWHCNVMIMARCRPGRALT